MGSLLSWRMSDERLRLSIVLSIVDCSHVESEREARLPTFDALP